MKRTILIILLIIVLANFRVAGQPTTTLKFKVHRLDTSRIEGILDFEGSDNVTLSYSYSLTDPNNIIEFGTTTDYAYSGNYSYYFYWRGGAGDSITVIYTFDPGIHSIYFKWKHVAGSANLEVYRDGELVYSDSADNTNKETEWIELLCENIDDYTEMKIVIDRTADIGDEYFYIDYGRRFYTKYFDEIHTVEYVVFREEFDKFRSHYTLYSSELSEGGNWGDAYLEGSFIPESGNCENNGTGLIIYPGSSEYKFYRDYTESEYPHEHYFVILKFDNGTLCNSTVQLNYGTSEEEVSNWLWYKEKTQITQEFYTVKSGNDWYRHFRVHPSVTAYVPTPTDTYSYITFNIQEAIRKD